MDECNERELLRRDGQILGWGLENLRLNMELDLQSIFRLYSMCTAVLIG